MLKALFGSPKSDSYNQALDHFRKLRHLSPQDPAYSATLLMIVRLSQLTIQQRPGDGDAHVLLANAFLLIALEGVFTPAYEFAIVRAAAAIFHWKTVPMYTKDKAIGQKILNGVAAQLNADRPSWMGRQLPRDLAALHNQYYGSAIDPSSLEELSRLSAREE